SLIPRLEASNFQFSTVTDRIENAICIFVDFYFGQDLMRKMKPAEACDSMNRAFIQFDDFLKGYPDYQKLKTVATKVLLLCRLDNKHDDKFGVRLTDFLRDTHKKMSQGYSEDALHICPRSVKIGVSAGPVVAGIVLKQCQTVGREKFTYDIYGDTCNMASRMQTLDMGAVLISDSTYAMLAKDV
ncbi:hypothetical protein HDV05_002655, partial [Chytridiales sp. JEL 0842]